MYARLERGGVLSDSGAMARQLREVGEVGVARVMRDA
jgi:hypothetical protein